MWYFEELLITYVKPNQKLTIVWKWVRYHKIVKLTLTVRKITPKRIKLSAINNIRKIIDYWITYQYWKFTSKLSKIIQSSPVKSWPNVSQISKS